MKIDHTKAQLCVKVMKLMTYKPILYDAYKRNVAVNPTTAANTAVAFAIISMFLADDVVVGFQAAEANLNALCDTPIPS